jgi:hypothetical protein
MNAPAVTHEVASRFHGLRRQFALMRIVGSIASALALTVVCWILLSVGDYMWEWSLMTRCALAALCAAAIVIRLAAQMFVAFQESRQRRFAGNLEQRFASLGQRLRTVLETVDGKLEAPAAMLSALGHQTLGRWETAAPTQILPRRKMTAAIGVSLALFVIAIAGLLVQTDWRTALLRSIGQDVPYTALHVIPGDLRLLEGSTLSLGLELHGRTNRDVLLRHRNVGSEFWTESQLLPVPQGANSLLTAVTMSGQGGNDGQTSPGTLPQVASLPAATVPQKLDDRRARFESTLGKLTKAVEYQFVTSAGSTRSYVVEVQPLIEVTDFHVLVTPPAYTQLEPRSFSTKELSVLAGSDVLVTIETNHPLFEISLQTGEKLNKLNSMEAHGSNSGKQWTFSLPSQRSLHWRFSGRGEDGTPMAAITGRLRVRHDEAPRLQWRDPDDEIKVHMLAEVPMRVQVSDDYGITEAAIVFQLGDEEEFVLHQWPHSDVDAEESPTTLTTQVRLEDVLPLESLGLSERDFIAYYAYAIDNREGAQQRVESDVRYIDIRPLRQFFSEIELDPGMPMGNRSLVPQLDEIIRRQRFLINRTRKYVRNPDSDVASQAVVLQRMVESQSELADLTRFLTDFLISRGNDDTEALSQAEAAMLQAVDSLSAGDFAIALVQEEDALRALAEARRTVELALLKNATAQQIEQLRNFRRQLQQKLRREANRTDQQLADSLQQIAAEQKRLANDAKALTMARAGASGSGESDRSEKTDQQTASQPSSPTSTTPDTESTASETGRTAEPPSDATAAEAAVPLPNAEAKDSPSTDSAQSQDANAAPSPDGQVAGGESADADQSGADGSSSDRDEQSPGELLTRQQDLHDRLASIEDGLSSEVKRSPLVERRMQAALQSMVDLSGKLRSDNIAEVPDDASELADQLRELAAHIDAIAQREPANRVSAMRDMTTSLANMEREVSRAMQQVAEAKTDEPKDDESTSTDQAANSDSAASGGSSQERAMATASRLGKRIDDRADTLEDVLKLPIEAGNLEASEVSDRIEKFVAESDLLGQLAHSREAIEQPESEKAMRQWTDAAMQRAVEYADAAIQLDHLYRQLVSPRVDRLRQLESQASQLSKTLAEAEGQAGMSKKQDLPEEQQGKPGGSVEMQQRELEQGLRSAGLDDLVEVLAGQEDEQTAEGPPNAEAEQSDSAFANMGNANRNRQHFSPNPMRMLHGRVLRVQTELAKRIQELILLEISADRDAPVPPQYRALVDGYFRTIAGAEVETETVQP